MFHAIEEALEALKAGEVIIVVDDENRENEGDFLVLGEHATPQNINFMAMYGRGLICTPVSQSIADKLQLQPMVQMNTDVHQTAFTVSVDYKTTTTGISAFERSDTMLAMLDEDVRAEDFRSPGHVFPLLAKDGGVLERRGHTEAAVDLAKLCDSAQVGVICEIMNADGTMARVPDLWEIAKKFNLKFITIDALALHLNKNYISA